MKNSAIALVALAVSSGSAATVGAVYTTIAQQEHRVVGVAGGGSVAGQGSVISAVVLNASDAFSARDLDAAGSPDSSDVGSQRRLSILGTAQAIPPIWLGADSEDRYSALNGNPSTLPLPDMSSPFELVVLGRDRETQNGSGNQSQTGNQTGPQDQNDLQTTSVTVQPTPPPDFYDIQNAPIDQLASSPPDVPFPIGPQWSNPGSGAAVPEPATWAMLLAGFAGLFFAGYRKSIRPGFETLGGFSNGSVP